MATRLAFARHLVEGLGLSVIPTRGKRPAVKWARFQEARPTPDELVEWFGNGQAFDPGIVCGAVSRVVAVDSDDEPSEAWAREHLPATPMMTRTPNGWHRFYRHPGGSIRNKARVKTGDAKLKLDVRADGGFVVGPGATHPTGQRYTMPSPWPASVDELPTFDPAWVEPAERPAPASPPRVTTTPADERVRRARAYLDHTPPAVQGDGGDTHTFGVCCRVVRGFDLTDGEALEVLSDWNGRCVPPWTERELVEKIGSARTYGTEPIGGRLEDGRSRAARSTRASLVEAAAPRAVHLTKASSITVRPVRWLWQDRLPLGAIALLGGREGVGKSTLAYSIAALVTRGHLPGFYQGSSCGVVVAATEDSWGHTIVPRLMVAGADLDHVYRVDVTTGNGIETALSLPHDLGALKEAIVGVNAALIVLDPLMSRLDASLDSHKDAEVRTALEPLVALAEQTNTTALSLIHVSKSQSTDPLTLLMGSRAFPAVARSALALGRGLSPRRQALRRGDRAPKPGPAGQLRPVRSVGSQSGVAQGAVA